MRFTGIELPDGFGISEIAGSWWLEGKMDWGLQFSVKSVLAFPRYEGRSDRTKRWVHLFGSRWKLVGYLIGECRLGSCLHRQP